LPQSAPWLTQFLDEHSNSPNSRFDDTVDTTTQALNFLRGIGPPGIVLYYQEEAEKVRKENEAKKIPDPR
jgi:hypothetical protein